MSSEPPRRKRGKGGRAGPAAGKASSRKAPAAPGARKARGSKGGKGSRPGKGVSPERSAGGVVVREGEVVVIVPTRRASDGSKVLALPKGHIDPGETPLQAALREVREETGIVGEPVSELGETRYWYRREGRTIPKSVSFYLFKYVEGDTSEHDDEVEDARWLPLAQALRELSHAAEREMVAHALAYLEAERKDR
jgi:8-oxo-dGTP pyrophosphatase MutT (NUDIX family)